MSMSVDTVLCRSVAVLCVLYACVLYACVLCDPFHPTYAFTRDVSKAAAASTRRGGGDTRRVFGGAPVQLALFPGVVALLDRYWDTQCSGSWLADHWVLTAAHCVTPDLAYVRYNTQRLDDNSGDSQPVLYLFRHPKFQVVQEDEGRGEDVTVLHHDIGLVRTRRAMSLRVTPHTAPLSLMGQQAIAQLAGKEATVLGYGDTGKGLSRRELYSVQLKLIWCERGSWFHCVCAVSSVRTGAGVCAGDSGGPVLGPDGTQLAVTSMGPVACAQRGALPDRATSVLTAVAPYVTLLNATMHDADAMTKVKPRSFEPLRAKGGSLLSRLTTAIPAIVIVFCYGFSISI